MSKKYWHIFFKDIKQVYLNLLSLINVGLGFAFIVMLGRKLGLGEQTDVYFVSLVIITYLEGFVTITWSAIKHYYAELKINEENSLNKIYVILLNNIIISSSFIILLYFLITNNFNVLNIEIKAFLDVFIFFVLVHSLLTYNKKILNLEHNYASVYLVDIFVYVINLVAVIFFMEQDVMILAYTTIVSSSLIVIWQLIKIFNLNNFKYQFVFYEKEIILEIVRNSFKLNVGLILYNFKDIAIAAIFTGFSSGTYSLYSYANKFIGVVSSVVTGPIENVYTAKISHIVAKKDFKKASKTVRETLSLTSTLFLVSALITYFILPNILGVMIGDKTPVTDINTMQYLFIFLAAYTLLKVIELPYKKVLNLFKFFNFGIFINAIYFLIVLLGYGLTQLQSLNFVYILFFIIIGQMVKLSLSKYRYNSSMPRSGTRSILKK